MGIIGEPMTHYNPITLAPQGAENEEEEHEDNEKAGSNRREYVSQCRLEAQFAVHWTFNFASLCIWSQIFAPRNLHRE